MARKKTGDDVTEAKASKDDAGAANGKKKGGMLPAIIVAVALLAGGAMAGGVVGDGGDAASAAVPEPTPTVAELGTVVELESVTLNLAGDGSHFLKLGVAVELSPETTEEPATAPIYDIVIAQFGSYNYDDLVTAAQREVSKDALLANLADVYGGAITRVFYTEFVMQ